MGRYPRSSIKETAKSRTPLVVGDYTQKERESSESDFRFSVLTSEKGRQERKLKT